MAAIKPALLRLGEGQLPAALHFCPDLIFQPLPGPNGRVRHGESGAVQVDSLTCCNWVVWCGHQLQMRWRFWGQMEDDG